MEGRTAAKTWQREKPSHIQGTPPECQIPRSLPARDSAAECGQQSEPVKTRPGIPSWGGRRASPGKGRKTPALQSTGCPIPSSLGSNLFDNHFWLRHHPLSINKSPALGTLPDSSLPGRDLLVLATPFLLSLHLRPLAPTFLLGSWLRSLKMWQLHCKWWLMR